MYIFLKSFLFLEQSEKDRDIARDYSQKLGGWGGGWGEKERQRGSRLTVAQRLHAHLSPHVFNGVCLVRNHFDRGGGGVT